MKIDFSAETEFGSFTDAIHLPDDHTFTQEEIEAMKKQRVDTWVERVKFISAQPPTVHNTGPVSEGLLGLSGIAVPQPPSE